MGMYSRVLERVHDGRGESGSVSVAGGDATAILEGESESDAEEEEEDSASDDETSIPTNECAAEPPKNTALTSRELAQIQKKQAWLRGGLGDADVAETASVKSAANSKRQARQPGLLERLFLPNTTAASHRNPSSKSHAATRPAAATRRRNTVDLSSVKTVEESAAGHAKSPQRSRASPKTKQEGKNAKTSKSRSTTTTTAAASAPASPAAKVECVTCMDEVSRNRAALLECKHRMCHSCLKRIFTLSTTDPQLMPPRCCTDNMIPLRHVDKLFDTKFKALWNRKYAEYTTKHRLYCPTKNCGLWIKPKYIERDVLTGRKKASCKECKTKICVKCGLKWHAGRDCENDESTRTIVEMGKEHGWQRCYSCRAMVQLSEGCNHMRCRCNAEFCMVCGQKWKTCDCPWFNLPPDLGVDGFLDPNQALPLLPLDIRIGNLPPPPPLLEGFENFLSPRHRQLPFRDRRDMPLDPLNPGDIFRPADLGRPRERRRRTMPAVPLSSREQEAADEALARRLQDQEFQADEVGDGDAELRRRATRRQRRRVYAVAGDGEMLEIGDDAR